MKVHPVFHISLLEPTENPENSNDEATEDEYEVENILKRKLVEGRIFYLVSWKGYGPEHNSWEPVRHLNCPEKIRAFRQKETRKGRGRTRC